MEQGRAYDNYISPLIVLERLSGTGYLQGEISQACNFSVARLLNGRLRVEVVTKKDLSPSHQDGTFEIIGVDEQGLQVTVTGAYFTLHKSNPPREAHLGYARSFTRQAKNELAPDEPITVRCDLVNFGLISSFGPTSVKLNGFNLEIERLHWEDQHEIREHGYAYQHATIQACIRIGDIPFIKLDEAIECLRNVAQLLSIACRGYVFTVAQHVSQGNDNLHESHFEEPPFTSRHWPRPLIHDKNLVNFLETTYDSLVSNYREYELGNVFDHYFQALTVRSVWPLSLGIFTAMETLKTAYMRRAENDTSQFWVIPHEDFKDNHDLLDDFLSVLLKYYPRFSKLTKSEKDSLRSQIQNLNRRSYRTQLRTLFSKLDVSYDRQELQSFIDIRNSIIHEGTPVRSDVEESKYMEQMAQGWKRIEKAASLFERTLLAQLGYTGPKELFDATGIYG